MNTCRTVDLAPASRKANKIIIATNNRHSLYPKTYSKVFVRMIS